MTAACERAVHVILPDGEVQRAGRATLTILIGLGWWWVKPFQWPPLIWFVEVAYWVVARNRIFFSRFLFTRRD